MKNTKQPLTQKQANVMWYIRRHLLEFQRPPTRAEIAKGANVKHVSNVGWFLQALENKGWITVDKKTRRGISVVQSERVPVYEFPEAIPPGEVMLDPKHIVEYVPEIVATAWSPSASYCMRIGERDMRAAGFRRGDLVGVRASDSDNPTRGQAIIVRVDGEVMCRVYERRTEQYMVLVTLGEDGKPAATDQIDLGAHDVQIEGVVVHAFMSLDLAEFDFLEGPPEG